MALPVRTELNDSCVAWTDLAIFSLASPVTSTSPSGRAEVEEEEAVLGAARACVDRRTRPEERPRGFGASPLDASEARTIVERAAAKGDGIQVDEALLPVLAREQEQACALCDDEEIAARIVIGVKRAHTRLY